MEFVAGDLLTPLSAVELVILSAITSMVSAAKFKAIFRAVLTLFALQLAWQGIRAF